MSCPEITTDSAISQRAVFIINSVCIHIRLSFSYNTRLFILFKRYSFPSPLHLWQVIIEIVTFFPEQALQMRFSQLDRGPNGSSPEPLQLLHTDSLLDFPVPAQSGQNSVTPLVLLFKLCEPVVTR